jgi:hypothetical protein
MPKIPVTLCLHDIKDEGLDVSSIKMALLTFPNVSPDDTYDCYYQNQIIGEHEITSYENISTPPPIARWFHSDAVYYVAWVEAKAGQSVFCPPLVCRSDNTVIIIVDDEMDAFNTLNNSPYSPQVFTNISPNENGCVTLPINLSETENPYPENLDPQDKFYAFVYYQVPELQGKVICQKFPLNDVNQIKDLRNIDDSANGTRLRIGFKTFYDANAKSAFSTETLPLVWIDFRFIRDNDE